MKLITLKIFIALTGVFSLFLLFVVNLKAPPDFIMDKERVDDQAKLTSGDLYYMCNVNNFYTRLPEHNTFDEVKYNCKPDDADILIFGDSFFEYAFGTKTMPEILADSLGKKIYFKMAYKPLNYLAVNFSKERKRFLIYETVERCVSSTFSRPHTNEDREKFLFISFISRFFPESKEDYYNVLLKNGNYIGRIYSKIITLKFNAFGLINDEIPIYTTNPNWLFYFQDVKGKSGFYYNYTDDEISDIAEKIEGLSKILDERYNLEMLFMVIPNKYTLYHTFANNDVYNEFIPRLYKELGKRNVGTIDVYSDFKKSNEILYFPTDTHWNEKGLMMAAGKIIGAIRERLEE